MWEDDRPWRRLYNLARWKRLRARKLLADPLCVYCMAKGEYVPATIVDHVKQHFGNLLLFWDWANLQSLCKPCHDGRKQKEDKGAVRLEGTQLDGYPTGGTW